MAPIEEGHLRATAFHASSHGNDQCGSNGLPLTPNSVRITGQFQKLCSLEHQYLCEYVELHRGKHEQIMIVTEGQNRTMVNMLGDEEIRSEILKRWCFEMITALTYLHEKKIVHRNMSLDNLYLDSKNRIKLAEFGLYHMTEYGSTVLFPIGRPQYMPAEVFLDIPAATDPSIRRRTLSHSEYENAFDCSSAANVDSWSLGIIMLEIISGKRLWNGQTVDSIIESILQLAGSRSELSALDYFLKIMKPLKDIDANLLDVVKQCLILSPSGRPCAGELLLHPCFKDIAVDSSCSLITYTPIHFTKELNCEHLTLENIYNEPDLDLDTFLLRERSFEEVYYLWKLAGRDLESVLRRHGLLQNVPPIISLYNFVSSDGDMYGESHDSSMMYSSLSVKLDLSQLCERLAEVDPVHYYPLCETEDPELIKTPMKEAASLPLVIRERDVEYQFHRLVLFDRLLKGYPYKKARIVKEARVDIPPLYRALVWAAILDIKGDIYEMYDTIDKVSPRPIDRQIEVDVPRCHQYNELMSSPAAHRRLKRVLKAWVSDHPQYVYWQGLDSLCAPFLYLNFNDEALAFACLRSFIAKYLHNFFLKDNSAVVQEYLALFSQLIAFHEAELSNHLDEIGFMPDLYAIPWFLTMYAHVFPLHKLFHLWDTLILGASAFPLCIGVAILQQLKARLLTYGFNECILLFSDLPEINIDQCVSDSVKVFCATPKSATLRVHAPINKTADPAKSKSNLRAEPLPLLELKSQRCCGISGEEMLVLLAPEAERHTGKPKLVVIDARTQSEYERGTLPGAMNAPFATAFTQGQLSSAAVKEFLDAYKYQVKVVVDSSSGQAGKFAAKLVSLGYSKVCYLHKGMNILKGSNLLIVPSTL